MAKTTTREAMIRFCAAIEGIYAGNALRKPSIEDINRLLNESYKQGWPGCIGSIDCMHWTWKNCPSAWAGMFTGKEGKPTVVLEAVAVVLVDSGISFSDCLAPSTISTS